MTYDEMKQESVKNNLSRLTKALKKLERIKGGTCLGCGKEVYRDAAVLIRPGFWIAPASFHEQDCPIAKVMSEIEQEVIVEERTLEIQWSKEFWAQPVQQDLLAKAKKIIDEG